MLDWTPVKKGKQALAYVIVSLILTIVSLRLCCVYLSYNETRIGVQLNDWVLNQLAPADWSTLLFAITWACIVSGVIINAMKVKKLMHVCYSIISIIVIRCIVMYMVPLEPPEGIIPLRDNVLEGSFYSGEVLLKDLFFSGHTSNLVLLTLLIDIKWVKIVFGVGTVIVAFLLLKQHVHYTIDVLAAPFFAYLAYRLGGKISRLLNNHFFGEIA